jgi:DNA-binding NtrC family response regulator
VSRNRILIVDDEAGIRFGIRDYLESQGFEVDDADSCRTGEEAFRNSPPDACILDYSLLDGNALELLPRLKAIDPAVPVIILTAHGSIDLAVRAIKEGAEQFLTKPVELPALLVLLQRAMEVQRNRRRQLAGESRLAKAAVDPFLGTSAPIRALAEMARKVAVSSSPILIQGETGSGKGVLASWIHENGPRREEPFVDLNCAGLSREFLETELFGHEKGAFTGAAGSKTGLLEIAHGGTVFLDEMGDMDPAVQPKLLKVLEDKKFRRLGDVRDRRVDIRLIAATHQDLAGLVRENKFRSDLYYRVSAIPLAVPALRDRQEDIPMLARQLLARLASDLGRGEVRLAAESEKALLAYRWPGNVRELRNVLERAVLISGRDVLLPGDLHFDAPAASEAASGEMTLQEIESRQIEKVLKEENGQVDRAARRLGIPRSTLYEKIKKLGLSSSRG